MNRQGKRYRLWLIGVVVATALMLPTAAFAASGGFTGGVDQWPTYVPSDHTPVAVHFTASGLATSTPYYLKVRYTVGTAPSGSSNRGFTWNPTSKTWVQERVDWLDPLTSAPSYPIVTTDANGNITNNAGWTWVKFGDESKTGPYHIMISLSATGVSSTLNSSIIPTITVINQATEGGWVHNGIATGIGSAKRAAITDEASTTIYSLQKTEANLIDDDSDGIVDNENYGGGSASGDFRMAVPTNLVVGANLNQTMWAPAAGFMLGTADVDLAISAAETQAPTAPPFPVSTAGETTATVTWLSATDNTAVAGYLVYRWQAAPDGAAYTPLHAKVATLAPGVMSYEDSGLTLGETYFYEIRAFDAATNVGPRSTTVTVTPTVALPTAEVSPASPDGEDGWYRTAPVLTLTPSTPGRDIVYSFDPAPSEWTTYTAPITIQDGESTITYAEMLGSVRSASSTRDFKVDTGSPTAAITVPKLSPTSATRSFPINWVGVDSGSGVDSYDVEYRSGAAGAWTQLYHATTATSAMFTGALGGTYYFRVRSNDVASNVGQWATSSAVLVPFDQTKAWYYSGSWKKTSSSGYYEGSTRYSTQKGGYAKLTFSSGTLYLVSRTGPKLGKMAVYFKGKKVGTVNLYSPSTKNRQVIKLFSKPAGTSAGTVKLVNLGVSGHTRVEIDGFVWQR